MGFSYTRKPTDAFAVTWYGTNDEELTTFEKQYLSPQGYEIHRGGRNNKIVPYVRGSILLSGPEDSLSVWLGESIVVDTCLPGVVTVLAAEDFNKRYTPVVTKEECLKRGGTCGFSSLTRVHPNRATSAPGSGPHTHSACEGTGSGSRSFDMAGRLKRSGEFDENANAGMLYDKPVTIRDLQNIATGEDWPQEIRYAAYYRLCMLGAY